MEIEISEMFNAEDAIYNPEARGGSSSFKQRMRKFLIAEENNSTTICENIFSHERIGSDSMFAEVYKIVNGGIIEAAKILHINRLNSEETNAKEVMFATLFSDIVKDGICPYFPIVYNVINCSNTLFPEKSKFRNSAIIYAYLKMMSECLGKNVDARTEKIFFSDFALIKNADKLKEVLIEKFYDSECINLILDPENSVKLRSTILISEFAYSDLRQFLKENRDLVSDENYQHSILLMIKKILLGIKCMQDNGVVHDDLHYKNVLIMDRDPYNIIPMIHDFGKSYMVSETQLGDWDLMSRTVDISRILNDIKQFFNMRNIVNQKISILVSFIEEFVTRIELQFEQLYDQIGSDEEQPPIDTSYFMNNVIDEWNRIISQ
jgi:serine/threonine protein kinase